MSEKSLEEERRCLALSLALSSLDRREFTVTEAVIQRAKDFEKFLAEGK